MAQRRMFSPDIVGSEEFLSMPVSSRELYFQLGMNADDDGFVQPKLVMRLSGATDDDLRVLLAKRFLIPFESGVVVIKHWLIHNMIRADRYKPTRFQKEKQALKIKENKAYSEVNKVGLQNGNQLAPQVRLGKVRKEETVVATPRTEEAFNQKEYIQTMLNDKARHIQIIGLFMEQKGFAYPNKAALQGDLKRNLKPAKQLIGWDSKAILKTIDWLEKRKLDWGLEGIVRNIAEANK